MPMNVTSAASEPERELGVAEEREIHHRRRAAPLDEHEQHEQHGCSRAAEQASTGASQPTTGPSVSVSNRLRESVENASAPQ